MKHLRLVALLIVLFLLNWLAPVNGQESASKPKVSILVPNYPGIAEMEVDSTDSTNVEFSGFDVELVTMLNENIGYDVYFKSSPNDSVFDRLEANEANAAVGGWSRNAERKKRGIKFSDSYASSQFAILKRSNGVWKLVSNLKYATIFLLASTLITFLICYIFGLLYRLFEGKAPEEAEKTYRGIMGKSHVLYWSEFAFHVLSTIGLGSKFIKTLAGYILSVFNYVFGAFVDKIITAVLVSLTTIAFIQEVTVDVASLKGEAVIGVTGTTSQASLRTIGARLVHANDLSDGLVKLFNEEADYLVAGELGLRYIVNNIAPGRVEIVSTYGQQEFIAFPFSPDTDPEYIARLNLALDKAIADGRFQKIWEKYFGKN